MKLFFLSSKYMFTGPGAERGGFVFVLTEGIGLTQGLLAFY